MTPLGAGAGAAEGDVCAGGDPGPDGDLDAGDGQVADRHDESDGDVGSGDRVVAEDLVSALAATHDWFEVNSGWAPPDEGTLIDWGLEGIGRAPDECLVREYGVCRHGLVSWQVVLDDLVEHDLAHRPDRPPARRPAPPGRPEPVPADHAAADPDHRALGLP